MSENQILSPLNWAGKKTNALLDILEIIRSTGAKRIWDATTGSGTIPYFLSFQPNLEIFASDIDPHLISFHKRYSEGELTQSDIDDAVRNTKDSTIREQHDDLCQRATQTLKNTGIIDPVLYYIINKLAFFSGPVIKEDGTVSGTPKSHAILDRVKILPPPNDYSSIEWGVFDYVQGNFWERSHYFDLIILDPPYWGQRGHYDIEERSQELDFEILSTSKKIVYFQLDSPYIRFFVNQKGYHHKIYELKTSRQKKTRIRKEILICTHPAAH